MSDDLVKRLRNPPFGTESSERNLMASAADALDTQTAEITSLRARVAELETALQFIKDAPDEERKPNFNNMGSYEAGLRYCATFARAALKGKKDE